MSSADLQHVKLGIPPSKLPQRHISAADYYEILRVAPHADEDTIERVYRTLADRFHPDNPSTGDEDTFQRLREAYETLSDRAERAKYNVMRRDALGMARFRLRGREFFDGVRGGQNRRLAVLCLLYRQRIRTQDSPGLSILDLEQLTGCTREEITAALWYLCEKKWATIGEFTTYSITAEGFDFVERKLEDRMEFRALATWSYYDAPVEPESAENEGNALPLDIEPAISQIARNGHLGMRTPGGEVFLADHYEILGIAPRSDEEVIERVYSTLASRFHPDNPSTGDARTFQRIREAYETLSDPEKRRAYDDLRERTKHSERFRLRGREFFDGIKGEQLRRLAVLCLLYRQAAGELPGLTVLDLEQLTGCTREELGSALWYLREKKWAKYGDFTEYSITAAGFDVVENKLDEREAARSRGWLVPEDARAQIISVTPQALIGSAEVPENPSSNTELVEIEAEQVSEVNAEVVQAPTPGEEAASITEDFARLESGFEAEAQSRLSIPDELGLDPVANVDLEETEIAAPTQRVMEVSETPTLLEAPDRIAEELARVETVPEGASDEQPTPAPEPASMEGTSEIADAFAGLETEAEVPPESKKVDAEEPTQENSVPAAVPTAAEDAVQIAKAFARLEVDIELASKALAARIGATNIPAEELSEERDEGPAMRPVPTRFEEAPRRAETVTRLESPDPPRFLTQNSPRNTGHGETELHRSGSLGRFVRRLLNFGDGPIAETQLDLRITPESPMWKARASENRDLQSAPDFSTAVKELSQPVRAAAPIEPSSPFATEQAPALPESRDTKPEVDSKDNGVGAKEPIAPQEVPGMAEAPIGVVKPVEAPNPWAWLMPEDIAQTPIAEKAEAVQEPAPIEEKPRDQEEVARVELKAETPAQSIPVVPQSPGVSEMKDSKNTTAEEAGSTDSAAAKRVILSMGGKGGVGKTSVMTGLAEWFDANQIPVNLLDLDTENKAKGSLTHFFDGRVPKINIHTPAGLDAFVDLLSEDAPAILADMGAGAGKVTHEWFDKMYPDVAEAGVVFTAVGVVTSDPASVESVVNWSAALQDRVDYVIVENCLSEHADFSYWQENDLAQEFRERFQPAIIRMDYRLADLENAARNYGVTLGRVASRSVKVPELQKASLVMRAQSYRRRMFAEFDKVKELLLP